MKNIKLVYMINLLTIILFILFFSCRSFEEDYKIKSNVRNQLKKHLHDPSSFEDVNWFIFDNYEYVDDTINKKILIDFTKTREKDNIKYIELKYRAKNLYGALGLEELYLITDEKGTIILSGEKAKRSVLYQRFLLIHKHEYKNLYDLYSAFIEENPEHHPLKR